MTDSPVSDQLRQLRKRAGLSGRRLAELLEQPHGSYADYEKAYKQPGMPIKWVRRLLPILVGRGEPPITHAEVMALAGLTAEGTLVTSGAAGDGARPPEPEEKSNLVDSVAEVPFTKMDLFRDEVRLISLWRGLDDRNKDFFLGLIRDALIARKSA